MHFILGLLGTLVTILVLLSRLADAGISLGGLNPFLWNRRKNWREQQTGDPIFRVTNPMEVSALLLTATAKIDGEISRDQKDLLLNIFKDDFHQSEKDAAGLLRSSIYLLGDGEAIQKSLDKVLKPGASEFSESQVESTVTLLQRVCELDTTPNELRRDFVNQAKNLLTEPQNRKPSWN